MAQESIVLLKNEKGTLPLDKSKIKSVVVIGPYADQVISDWYSGLLPYAISPRKGVQDEGRTGAVLDRLGEAFGCEDVAQGTEGLPKSLFAAGRNNDRTIAASRRVAGLP